MRKGALVFLIYCAITVALTYPLIRHMGSVLPSDAGDPALNTWILWWNTQALPLSAKWWNAPAFYPAPGVLAFSEHLLGLSLIAAPLQWLGAAPLTAYNAVFLLTFPLSAIGAYLLTLELTKRSGAAFVAGMLFGFAPYRLAHLAQVQVLASFAAPIALLGLHRYVRDPRPKWLVMFAAGWLLQALCNGYYLLFFSVLVGLWVLWFASPWKRPTAFVAIGVAWMLAALPMLPLLLRYRQVHASFGLSRDFDTIRNFSADVAALLQASPNLAVWGRLQTFPRSEGELFAGFAVTLLVVAAFSLRRYRTAPRAERKPAVRPILGMLAAAGIVTGLSPIFVGPWAVEPFGVRLLSVSSPVKAITWSLALAVALVITSTRMRRVYASQSVLMFYALAAVVMWVLTLGPVPSLVGQPLVDRGPYALLMFLPGFNLLRVPARFWMMAILCLAVAGAVIFDRLTRARGQMRNGLVALISIVALCDGWMAAMPLVKPPPASQAVHCAGAGRGPLLELPLGDTEADVAAMYRQMNHGRPVLNGYSGYLPPHYSALRVGIELRDPDVLTLVAAPGEVDVLVHDDRDRGGELNAYVRAHPGAQHLCTHDRQSLYRISGAAPAAVTAAGGMPVQLARIRANVNDTDVHRMVDHDRTTRWHSGPQSENTIVDFDLGVVRTVVGVDVLLGPFADDFPRGLVIELSEDGTNWRQVWQGRSAALAYTAALDAPLDIAMKYRFPPGDARRVRMRQTMNDPVYYWSIAEVRVLSR